MLFSYICGEFGLTVSDAGFLHSPRSASVTRTCMKFCTSSCIFLSLNLRSLRTINRPHIFRSSSSSSARMDADMTEGVGELICGGLMMIGVACVPYFAASSFSISTFSSSTYFTDLSGQFFLLGGLPFGFPDEFLFEEVRGFLVDIGTSS